MTNISFEVVLIQAGNLLDKCLDQQDISGYYLKLYLAYLSACGWTEHSFNEEFLKRIDLEWDRILNPLKFMN